MQTTSESVGTIFAALAKAQGIMQNPRKNAINPRFGSAYSTLDEGLNVAREALASVDVCIIQTTYMQDHLLMLETRLGHSSGEWISSHYPVIGTPFKPQDGLASLTYARRAALFALVGIAGEDDDGNAANKAGMIQLPTPAVEEKKEISDEEIMKLYNDMTSDLNSCQTMEDLDDWAELYRPQKQLLRKEQQIEITSIFTKVKATLKEENNG
jgi:hypothetical protein